MNNEQFRKLILANSSKRKRDENGTASPTTRPGGATPSLLGSRHKSSIPMTPRSVAVNHSDFARQLAERNQSQSDKLQKKLRTSTPKGSKLATGYVDRARTRQEEEEEDERATRLKALEEALHNEEIDKETYERLRGEIAGGDLSTTHLVKGLDFKLLERIRKGENVYHEKDGSPDGENAAEEPGEDPQEDLDDELGRLEAAEVHAIVKEKTEKKGQFATTGLNPGQKRTRNQILAELRAAREAAKAKQESGLGSKFKKIGAKKAPGTRFEVDSKGREVMIIVDEDGHERRKVRKLNPAAAREQQREREAFVPDKNAEVLGMEVPEFYRKRLEQEQQDDDKEVNIFDDAGSDYDPLADLEGASDNESDKPSEGEVTEGESEGEESKPELVRDAEYEKRASESMPPPPRPAAAASGPRNYFKDAKTGLTSQQEYKATSIDDPTFMAALKKAKALGAAEKSEEEQKEAARRERLKQMLQNSSRDDDDLDMGFGSSRLEDEADLEEGAAKVKLSAWGGGGGGDDDDDDDGGGRGGKGKEKRKRGSKKRQGDKNSFADVMRVIERNKGGGGG